MMLHQIMGESDHGRLSTCGHTGHGIGQIAKSARLQVGQVMAWLVLYTT